MSPGFFAWDRESLEELELLQVLQPFWSFSNELLDLLRDLPLVALRPVPRLLPGEVVLDLLHEPGDLFQVPAALRLEPLVEGLVLVLARLAHLGAGLLLVALLRLLPAAVRVLFLRAIGSLVLSLGERRAQVGPRADHLRGEGYGPAEDGGGGEHPEDRANHGVVSVPFDSGVWR